MTLHLALHLAHRVLQLPARALEGVVERELDVRIALVVLWGVADIDLAAFRQRQMNADLVKPAGAVSLQGLRSYKNLIRASARPGTCSRNSSANAVVILLASATFSFESTLTPISAWRR